MNKQDVQLLVVDDDRDLCHFMALILKQMGYSVSEAYGGGDALQLLRQNIYDVVLTDIMMPQLDGIKLMKEIKDIAPDTAVILITGVPSIETAVESIKTGAHSYLMKPCSNAEICAAVESAVKTIRKNRMVQRLVDNIHTSVLELGDLARKMSDIDAPDPAEAPIDDGGSGVVKLGKINVYRDRYQMVSAERKVDLTPTEYDVLIYLFNHRERIVTCADLVRCARGYTVSEGEAREVIRPHISNLRRKFKLVGQDGDSLVNVRGIGYRLADSL
ncbi:MAG: response regulator transcription factor [Chloroflexi bacterium]|nr:response regulator transcription factor [Chloroflexota bacterium]